MDRRSFIGFALAAPFFWALEGMASPSRLPRAELAYPWAWSVNLNIRSMTEDFLGYPPYLDLAAALGANLIRFDIYWKDLEPEPTMWLDNRLAWRVGIVKAARQRKLGVIVNLCGYPRWALSLAASDPDRFFEAWRRYVGRVAGACEDLVAYYQLDNEFNTVLDPLPQDLDARVFLEGSRALDNLGVRYPAGGARTVVNAFYGFNHIGSDWPGALERVLPVASSAIDVLALDDYPGSYAFWNAPSTRAWKAPLELLASYARRYDMLLAVGETGCPSYLLGQDRQAAWYVRAMASLARDVRDLDLSSRFTYVNLFELVDRPPLELWEFWRPTEVTLGLAGRDLVPKQAFYELHRMMAPGGLPASVGRAAASASAGRAAADDLSLSLKGAP